MDHLAITHDQITLGRVLLQDEHGARCLSMAVALARALKIADPHMLHELKHGAYWHDIGKTWVPEWIVFKAGPFDPQERLSMQQHPVAGDSFLQAIGCNGGIRAIVRHHHERWDGRGYPDGLAGIDIPMLARVVAPVDTYDAMRSHRNYPRYDAEGHPLKGTGEFSHAEAMRIIEQSAGSQFDPRVIKVFRRLHDREFR